VLLEGGLGFTADMTVYRTGASLDGDVELPMNARLLYGGEAFREWLPDSTTRSRQGPGIQAVWRGPYDLSKLPLPCPREPDGAGGVRFIGRCPLTMAFQTDRVVLGAFVNPQWRPKKKLILDGGARVQVAPESLGDIGYSSQLIFSGALVYNFIPDWHIKLNYSEGFRPPVFNNLVSNGEMAQIDGKRDLAVETSQAGQAEVNARLFKGERRIRELNFRADYSYTRLENLIQIVGGRYENSADRGIHSGELLGKLYLQGGHRFELGYTWLRIQMGDKGRFRAIPEHWFNVAGVFSLIPGKLEATTTLRVLGAFEDPNRLVEYRDRHYDDSGQVVDLAGRVGFIDVQPSEMVVDRIPPSAELMAGLAFTGIQRLRLTAAAYNALDARHFNPDAFHEYETRLEFVPSPYEDFRFVINAAYDY
jgi:outer membrane receptor protein involved in Fe transport